jgi:hypothetical protein
MEINFECKKCRSIFDCDVGTITVHENSDRPQFEQSIFCPTCGELTIDEVLLTELGQSQLTEATFDFEGDELWSNQDDDLSDFGFHEGECQGCDSFQSLNDLGLCEECAGKLERDLIRESDRDYTISGYGLDSAECEEIRKKVIKEYGEKLELIASNKPKKKKRKATKRKKKKAKTA